MTHTPTVQPDARWFAKRDRQIAKNQRESARQRDCWRILGLGWITSTHKRTDRCRKCGFDGRRIAD